MAGCRLQCASPPEHSGGDLLLLRNQSPPMVFDHPERHVQIMKHGGRIAFLLAGGLALQTNVRALTSDGSPYAAIVKSNVFRLTTPLPVEISKPVVSLPTIVLLGIVSGYGPKQVMFKTLEGTPPRETRHVLGEKELAGEIEVIEIIESAGSVRVKNHGQEQTLSLEKDGMKPGGISPATGPGTMARSGPVGGVRGAGPNPPQKPDLTAEEQMVLMEVNRKLTAGQVEKGQMPPLPPTPITSN
jgi:hypothetical protein